MDLPHFSIIVLILVITTLYGSFVLIGHLCGLKYDPREPPLIPPKIPYIGHVISLILNGNQYYSTLKIKFPICTLQMLTQRTYIITTTKLIADVQKNSDISHLPIFIDGAADKVSGATKAGIELVKKNLLGENGDWGLHRDTNRGLHRAMAPGPALDGMTKAMVDEFSLVFDDFANELNGPGERRIKLYEWTRHAVTVAVTNAAYGPLNPFKVDPSLEAGFWTFESRLSTFLVGLYPQITARTAYYCRQKVSVAMEEYFGNGHYKQGSELVKSNHDANIKNNLPSVDQGRFQMPNLSALLVNTSPGSFWFLWHIYSDPDLLEDIRQELDCHVVFDADGARTIDLSRLKDHCPLLFSTYQETLRFHSHGAQVKTVLEDTMLGGYYLKKGSLIHMPAAIIHSDPSIWGPDVLSFNPRRFYKTKKQHNPGFRTFSSGSTLCPGRQFATSTIMAFTAMFVIRFDAVPKGEWRLLEQRKSGSLVAFMVPPNEDVEVTASLRIKKEGNWRFGLSEKEKRWGLASG